MFTNLLQNVAEMRERMTEKVKLERKKNKWMKEKPSI